MIEILIVKDLYGRVIQLGHKVQCEDSSIEGYSDNISQGDLYRGARYNVVGFPTDQGNNDPMITLQGRSCSVSAKRFISITAMPKPDLRGSDVPTFSRL